MGQRNEREREREIEREREREKERERERERGGELVCVFLSGWVTLYADKPCLTYSDACM